MQDLSRWMCVSTKPPHTSRPAASYSAASAAQTPFDRHDAPSRDADIDRRRLGRMRQPRVAKDQVHARRYFRCRSHIAKIFRQVSSAASVS